MAEIKKSKTFLIPDPRIRQKNTFCVQTKRILRFAIVNRVLATNNFQKALRFPTSVSVLRPDYVCI